tara:strand:- start:2 stop:1669 length:1668 start_codon:yes stop_codon:yes gene_type:complete
LIFLKKTVSIILFSFTILFGKSQENKIISLFVNDTLVKTEESNQKNNNKLIDNQIISLIGLGYLSSSTDSVKNHKDSIHVYVSTGEKYNLSKIKILSKDNSIQIFNNLNQSNNLLFNPRTFSNKIETWLNYLNNNGYPFAKFSFDQSHLTNQELNVVCDLNTGPYIQIDSIYNPNISEKEINLISKITNIKKGDSYNLSLIKESTEKLRRVNYFSVLKPTAYEFIDNKAKIYTYVKSKAVNNINGLVGIQPSDDGKTQLTGNLSLTLLNTIKKGEMMHINWRKMFNASQNLITSFSMPYIFNSNFEIKGNLNMIKKDSTFFNIRSKANINYLIESNHSIGIVYDLVGSTNLLDNDYNSTSVNNFGFNFYINKLNQAFNPSKGFLINCELLSGLKKTYITENDEEKLLKTTNYFGLVNYEQFLKTSNRTTIKIGIKALTTINENLYENELSRIGGYQNLRGFDEESIFVSSYSIGNFEFRFLIDQKSNVFIFSDIAWAEKDINSLKEENYYNSIGLGTNFSINNGLLTIIYALGRETNQPFIIRTGKIHLGFTSYF